MSKLSDKHSRLVTSKWQNRWMAIVSSTKNRPKCVENLPKNWIIAEIWFSREREVEIMEVKVLQKWFQFKCNERLHPLVEIPCHWITCTRLRKPHTCTHKNFFSSLFVVVVGSSFYFWPGHLNWFPAAIGWIPNLLDACRFFSFRPVHGISFCWNHISCIISFVMYNVCILVYISYSIFLWGETNKAILFHRVFIVCLVFSFLAGHSAFGMKAGGQSTAHRIQFTQRVYIRNSSGIWMAQYIELDWVEV